MSLAEKNKATWKVAILIAVYSSVIILYKNSSIMPNQTKTKATSGNENVEVPDRRIFKEEMSTRNGYQLLNGHRQMNTNEWRRSDNVKSNAICQEQSKVGTIDESCNGSEGQMEGSNYTCEQFNQILSLTENYNSSNEERTEEERICNGNQDLKTFNISCVERNKALRRSLVHSRSNTPPKGILQGTEITENQMVTNASESEEEFEDAIDLRVDISAFEIPKVDRNLLDSVNTVSEEGIEHKLPVAGSDVYENNENNVDTESDGEYEDAIGVEECAVIPEGSKLNKELIETIDTYISIKNLGSLTQGIFNDVSKSDSVHIGNVSYDLEKVSLKQNVRMFQQLALPQSTASTSQQPEVEFRIVTRQEWRAERAMNVLTTLKKPVRLVIVSHTAGPSFYTQPENERQVRYIQRYHTVDQEWDDIGYNFLIGMDGNVYEGRGWDVVGAHTKNHNAFSIGVSFIGKFTFSLPTDTAIQAFQSLMIQGVARGHLAPDYKLHGACQLRPTLSPGEALFKEIMQWPNWAPVEENQ